VIIGANSVIIGEVKIGRGSRIGACTFVNKSVPAGAVAYNPRDMKFITAQSISGNPHRGA